MRELRWTPGVNIDDIVKYISTIIFLQLTDLTVLLYRCCRTAAVHSDAVMLLFDINGAPNGGLYL